MPLVIHCDGVDIDVVAEYEKRGFAELPPTPTMVAWHIRALADRPASYTVWHGEQRLKDNESVSVKHGMRFDCAPQANF